ncbi:MAG: uroporphyrinogen decarboxylase family protein [Candidatus Omnitrophota bacterium]
MTNKERFNRLMRFEPVDRVPLIEVGCWKETRDQWLKEGMPTGIGLDETTLTFNGNEYFRLDKQICLGLNPGILPHFEEKVLSEDQGTITIRNTNGAVVKSLRNSSAMPQFISFPVNSRQDFQAIKSRYDPKNPERYPADWKKIVASIRQGEDIVWGPGLGSVGLYSMIRTWMGTENACTIFYDDPALAREMVEFIVEFTLELTEPALSEVRIDYFMWWEDFSFKNGPLVSPAIFKEFLLPGYFRANEFLKKKGVEVIFIDTDGDPRAVIPLLIQSGINCLYPLEQCKEEMHPAALRREYGRDLRLWGGIDKRALTKGKEEIDRELLSKLPELLEDGGYLPQLDHLAPPDVSYRNWLYYLEAKRRICEGR